MDGGVIGIAIGAAVAVLIARAARLISRASWPLTFVVAIVAALIAGGFYSLLIRPPPIPETTDQVATVPTASSTAAALIDQKTVANVGESCAHQGIRLVVEGQHLVAYPYGDSPVRYEIEGQTDRRLRLRLGGRLIYFEIKDDGFIHIDQGQERWVRFCE